VTVVTGCEDTSHHCPGNDKDADRYTNLNPLVWRFFRVGGADVSSGSVVVGVTRAIRCGFRRRAIDSIIAGHSASREGVTKVFGRVREKGERKRKRDKGGRENEGEREGEARRGQRHRNAPNMT
jgi:hypothetical protein